VLFYGAAVNVGGGQVEAEGGFAETGLAGEDGEVAAGRVARRDAGHSAWLEDQATARG